MFLFLALCLFSLISIQISLKRGFIHLLREPSHGFIDFSLVLFCFLSWSPTSDFLLLTWVSFSLFSSSSSFLWELRPVIGDLASFSPVGVQCHKPSQAAVSHRRWYVVLSFLFKSKSFWFPFPFLLFPVSCFFFRNLLLSL